MVHKNCGSESSKKLRIQIVNTNGDDNMVREGRARLVNRPSTTGGKTYDRFYIYIATQVAKDGTFPFKMGDELRVRIEGDKLIIEKAKK
ncbi:MAG: hypothetical protein QW270_06915 [Candidatus Bathyarchaeia archaeon]